MKADKSGGLNYLRWSTYAYDRDATKDASDRVHFELRKVSVRLYGVNTGSILTPGCVERLQDKEAPCLCGGPVGLTRDYWRAKCLNTACSEFGAIEICQSSKIIAFGSSPER